MGYRTEHFRPGDIQPMDVTNINNLIAILSTHAKEIDRSYLLEVIRGSHVVIVRLTDHPDDMGPIVGMITFHFKPLFTGIRGYIDDLVIHPAHDGYGLGTELGRFVIAEARAQGAVTIDLTSNSDRDRALHLYKKLGFEPRDTNPLRLNL